MTDQTFFAAAARRVIALINSRPHTPRADEIERVLREVWQEKGPFRTPEGREAWRRKMRGEMP